MMEGGDQDNNEKFTIVGMAMDANMGDNDFIFNTIEPGRVN